MKLSDYVMSFLAERGVRTMFYLPGGGCMHLVDSLAASERLNAVSLLHEQAVAVACEAYANTSGGLGAALVTTGPGATNAITGILAAYLDSSPCFFISGQVKTADLKSRYGVRALGSQEADIVSMVRSITKYAVMVTDKNDIRYHLERAWSEAMSGRRGPVLLDIPLDIQGAVIDENALQGYSLPREEKSFDPGLIIEKLNQARRPLIIAGHGLSACRGSFRQLLDQLGVPAAPSWKALDFIPNNHPLYAGRVGGMGDRPGNLAMQNADLILSLGCRLDFSITGYDRTGWAPEADKLVVEIDQAEIDKLEQAGRITPVRANVADVVQGLLAARDKWRMPDLSFWKAAIRDWQSRYPLMTRDKCLGSSGTLRTYALIEALSDLLPAEAFIAPCSAGTTAEIFFQAFRVKDGQTIRSNHGLGAMGFDLPNAIGMCLASGGRPTVCIAGDGGMQLNIQELAVVAGRVLPIKLFVINNQGYASIRNMQNNLFACRHLGCDTASGLFLPNLANISQAYGLTYFRLEDQDGLKNILPRVLDAPGPVLCEVMVDADCQVSPRTASRIMPDGSMRSSPLENQYPFLPEDEVARNRLL